LLGIPAAILSASIHESDLERWWQAYLAYVPTFGNARVMPETSLSIPLSEYRVVAQYDAIVVSGKLAAERAVSQGMVAPGRPPLLIIDWKTYRQRPSRVWLAQRLQTRLYPLILVQAGASLIGQMRVEPGDIEMCYWLAEYPHDPQTFAYDVGTYLADLEFLSTLIAEIDERIKITGYKSGSGSASVTDDVWPLTGDLKRCRFCNFRSLCGRGNVAGPLADYVGEDDQVRLTADETGLDFDLDWGQVQEIAY